MDFKNIMDLHWIYCFNRIFIMFDSKSFYRGFRRHMQYLRYNINKPNVFHNYIPKSWLKFS